MSPRPWMPLYVADYLADTLDLSIEEHGVYFLLLMIAWRQPDAALPEDTAWLKRALSLHGNRFNRLVPKILARFWTLENGRFCQKRLGKEREKSEKFVEKQKENANKRWSQVRKNNDLCDATAMPARALQPQPQPHKREKINKRESSNPTPLEILSATLSNKTAQDVVDHRKALRKPLTARAAQGLADAFNAFGDPERAAEAMIVNGWQGFKPEWLNGNSHTKPKGRSNGIEGYLRMVQQDIENGEFTNQPNDAEPSPSSPSRHVPLLQPRGQRS